MPTETKTSAELIDRYEKNFGAAGRRRKLLFLGISGILLLVIVGFFATSMSYVGNLNAHIYEAFESKDQEKAPKP